MWSGLGDRLAGFGDALTERVTSSAVAARKRGGEGGGGTVVDLPPPAAGAEGSATGGDAVEGTGTTGAGAATDEETAGGEKTAPAPINSVAEAAVVTSPFSFDSLRTWTGTLAEATKRTVDATRDAVEKEQLRLQASAPSLFQRGGQRRDPNLPLDVEALRDAEVVYVTDRILTFSHPHLPSTTDGSITGDRKLAAVGHLLRKRHAGRFMVWNMSEVDYDASAFDEQVLTYKFPGSPSPPLGVLLKLLLSLESWLVADKRNVAALHCLTGRGRTSCVLAAFLCWTGEAGFGDVNSALAYVGQCKRLSADELTIPSQIRYAGYFANMLDGVRPSQPPLLLKRIVLSEAPKFGKRPLPSSADEGGADSSSPEKQQRRHQLGCAPYLQVFKSGTLVFTTAAAVNYAQSRDELPFCAFEDGHPVSFLVETVVRGDVLVRCRHLTKSGQRVSMFRCAFHTGYVPPRVLRLTKAQLDGACVDRRFSDDFYVDLIFEACDGATASRLLAEADAAESAKADGGGGRTGRGDGAASGSSDVGSGGDGGSGAPSSSNEAVERRAIGTVSSSANKVVSASENDSMLHRDSRFWDVIADQRRENEKKLAAVERGEEERRKKSDRGSGVGGDSGPPPKTDDATAAGPPSADDGADSDPASLWGPTIGKRRDFFASSASSTRQSGGGAISSAGGRSGGGAGEDARKKKSGGGKRGKNPILSAFSIGEEFGPNLGANDGPTPSSSARAALVAPPSPVSPKPKKRDELMEALMGLDDDGLDDDDDGEGDVVFEGDNDVDGDGSGGGDNDGDGSGGGNDAPAPTSESETEQEETPSAAGASELAAGMLPPPFSPANGGSVSEIAAPRTEEKIATDEDASAAGAGATTELAADDQAPDLAAATTDGVVDVDVDVAVADSDGEGELGIDDILGDAVTDGTFDDLDGMGDLDGLDLDDDDPELEDLENFLTQVSGGSGGEN